MNKNDIYIARHGLTEWNKIRRIQGQGNNLKLSPEGVAQMELLGKYLSTIENEYIIALSPMRRAQESFSIVNKYLNIKKENIHIINEMKEMNFGSFEGKLKSDIKSHSFFEERKTKKWKTQYPNGESYADLFERLSSSELNNIYQEAKNKKIAFLTIGHESINRVIPQILTPKKESNEQASKNRQQNNEVIVIKDNLKNKTEL
jgi:broad specificity phosphatase PhoE